MPTLTGRRFAPHVLLGLALPILAGAGEDENWQRLRSMPREQRAVLAEKIREFDRLDRDQKTAVRTLDDKVRSLSPDQQSHYRAVLRNYHLWLQTLPEDQRLKITQASTPKEKLALISATRERQGPDSDRSPTVLLFQLADLNGRSPFEVAHMLRLWFKLNDAERAEIEKLGVRDRMRRLLELSRQAKMEPLPQLTKAQEEATSKELDKQLESKGWLRNQLKKDSEQQATDRHRLINNYYFVTNPPKPVSSTNLLRFESSMPAWIRTAFDHLPPEEARRRLTILYRLIYPPGKEIAPKGPQATSKAAGAPKADTDPASTSNPAPTPTAAPNPTVPPPT